MKMSANVNETQPLICFLNHTTAKIGQTFAYCLIFVVSLAGNIFIGIIVYRTKTMRKPINFLIVNMAMSDLLYPIFLVPRALTELYVEVWLISGPLGQALCKLVPFLQNVSFAVSIQSLVLIAVDRFGAVVFPLRSPLIRSKLCPFFILATWIIAMAMCCPFLFAFKLVEYPGGFARVQQWISSFEHYILATVVALCSTLAFLAILYTFICLKLKTQLIPGEQTANATQQRTKRERNVLKMAMAIVVGFAVCCLPYSIGWFLVLFGDMGSCGFGFQYFFIVSLLMANVNCAINPCICFIFSGNYRQALKNLLRCF